MRKINKSQLENHNETTISYNRKVVQEFLNGGIEWCLEMINKKNSLINEKLFKFFWLMSQGIMKEQARQQAGLSKTIYDWCNKKNKKAYLGDERANELSDAIKKAINNFEAFHLRKITASKHWQSSAWILERSPLTKDKYKQFNRNELTGPNSEPLFNPYDKLSKEKKREILAELEKANKEE